MEANNVFFFSKVGKGGGWEEEEEDGYTHFYPHHPTPRPSIYQRLDLISLWSVRFLKWLHFTWMKMKLHFI